MTCVHTVYGAVTTDTSDTNIMVQFGESKVGHFLKYPGFIGPPVNKQVSTMVFKSSGGCLHQRCVKWKLPTGAAQSDNSKRKITESALLASSAVAWTQKLARTVCKASAPLQQFA